MYMLFVHVAYSLGHICAPEVLYLDFDVILFRDPLVPVLKAAEKARERKFPLARQHGLNCSYISSDDSRIQLQFHCWLFIAMSKFCSCCPLDY